MEIDARCKESFERQGLMRLIGAKLVAAADGRAAIEVPYRADLTQQHGYFHGGVVTAIADTASGYAAYTTMPADASVLTVEFKINLINPAVGDRLVAEAAVRKAGAGPWSWSERQYRRCTDSRRPSVPNCSAPSSSCAIRTTRGRVAVDCSSLACNARDDS